MKWKGVKASSLAFWLRDIAKAVIALDEGQEPLESDIGALSDEVYDRAEPDELDIATEDTIDLTPHLTCSTLRSRFHQPHRAQVRPVHRRHLRCWRMAALDTQRPAILVLPGPQPQATCVIMLSG